jgi:hypothetical protein
MGLFSAVAKEGVAVAFPPAMLSSFRSWSWAFSCCGLGGVGRDSSGAGMVEESHDRSGEVLLGRDIALEGDVVLADTKLVKADVE